MSDSILDSVKEIIGIPTDVTDFDAQLILHTNAILNTTVQIGVGKSGFKITGSSETWSDFLADEKIDTEWVREYVPLRVWVIFDANAITSGTMQAIKDEIKELETRFYYEKENWNYDQEQGA